VGGQSISLVIEFGTYTSSCVKTIIKTLPGCVKNNLKDLPVQGNNNDLGNSCLDSPVNAGR